MAQRIYLTGFGPDKPGIVAAITALVQQHGGNIEDATMTLIEDQFAFLLIAGVPDDLSLDAFKQAFAPVEADQGIAVYIQPLGEENKGAAPQGNPFMVSVAGDDKTGITATFSAVLAKHGISITDLSAKTIAGENGPAYVLMIETVFPTTINIPSIEKDLAEAGEGLNVEVTYHPIEAIAL